MLASWFKRLYKSNSALGAPDPQERPAGETPGADSVVEPFHQLYYNSHATTWDNTRWLGVKVLKCPLDLWIYQEILSQARPDMIIETGTRFGGSALYLASLCEMLGTGEVVSVDIEHPDDLPRHARLSYVTGSSVSEEVLAQIADKAHGKRRVMVILDSDHARAHVAHELEAYKGFVSIGQWLIVEDTNINGHPVLPQFGEGPMEAVKDFLAANDNFVRDESKEKFLLTFNPNGYLLKTR